MTTSLDGGAAQLVDPPPARVAMVNSDAKAAPALPDPQGVVTTLHDLRFRVLARSPYAHLFTQLGTLDVAERALAEGCDIVYVDTFGDYAVERIRALGAVPVVGAGEESIRLAASRYSSYSIVTVWPRSMAYLYDERLASTPGGQQCRGVHHLSDDEELDRVGRPDGVKARMLRSESELIDHLVALCRSAVATDRSEAVVLGCTCMSPVADALAARIDVPLIEPSATGLAAAHALAQEVRPGAPRPELTTDALATELVTSYLAAHGVESAWLDDCEVCAIPTTPSNATSPARRTP